MILVRLAPHGFGLRLDASDRANNGNRSVEYAQRTFDFRRKIDVAGRVDNINLPVAPIGGGRGALNRNAALLLLRHPVHGSRTVVYFAYTVNFSRIVKDAFGCGGFSRVDMGDNADIPYIF